MRGPDAVLSPLRTRDLIIRTGGSTGRIGEFGKTRNGGAKMHKGVDLLADIGTPVFAMHDGKVSRDGEQSGGKGYGQRLYVTGHKVESRYAHLSCEFVSTGEEIRAGHCIGLTGDSGNATPADGEIQIPDHVHIELWVGSTVIDPVPWLATHGHNCALSVPLKRRVTR